jgi:serine/threonine protein kinase
VQTIADYELIRSLGWGNHGQFFLARKPARLPVDVEFVAVKVFAGRSTADTFRRATRELKAFAAVPSPYIVSLYDAGQHDGVLYYSMEYLERGSLAEPDKPIGQSEAIAAVRDAALAVSALHAVGLVHRDIKPGNIMLHGTGGKLSDLGLAHVVAPGVTVTGMGPVASIEYTDPEQLQGAPAGPATDVWSLGVTLHRVLTGKGIYGEDLPADDGLLALAKGAVRRRPAGARTSPTRRRAHRRLHRPVSRAAIGRPIRRAAQLDADGPGGPRCPDEVRCRKGELISLLGARHWRRRMTTSGQEGVSRRRLVRPRSLSMTVVVRTGTVHTGPPSMSSGPIDWVGSAPRGTPNVARRVGHRARYVESVREHGDCRGSHRDNRRRRRRDRL